MRYKRELELAFDIASLQNQKPQIDLRYVPTTQQYPPLPEKQFFLHHIRQHLHKSPPSHPRRLLTVVSAAWDKAGVVSENIRRLKLSFPTSVKQPNPENEGRLTVTASVLLAQLQTRVEVVIGLNLGSDKDGGRVEVAVQPEARVVYGEGFNAGKMGEFLRGRMAEGEMGWDEAVLGLWRKLAGGKGGRGVGK